MKHASVARLVGGTLLAIGAIAAASCTTKKQEAPPLSGPSEFGTSIAVAVSPDVLAQDGASQSLVTVTARDSNGQPLRNLPMRVDIEVDGVRADFGSLSARNIVSGSDGRSTFVYTAPPAPAASVNAATTVTIAVTPSGSDFANAVARGADIRVIPPGTVVPPDDKLVAAFDVVGDNKIVGETLLFDASKSQSTGTASIIGYSWDFGDGRTGSGRTASHAFSSIGAFSVTLTVFDSVGRQKSASQLVTIGGGVPPTAAFAFSPTKPTPGQSVNFNGTASKAAPGRTIVSYQWDFGDGAFGSGPVVSHAYGIAGDYNVTLTVTDSTKQTAAVSQPVPVK